jgi:hypothetical protein
MPSREGALARCPCCDQQTITKIGCYEIGDLCEREDDPVQMTIPDYSDDANPNSLLYERNA